MCLAIPARIERIEDTSAWVRLGDAQVRVQLDMTPQAGPGDWVLVHAGFAIQQLDECDVDAIWESLRELEAARNSEGAAT
ncbi:MAG: HypC/HybG/HupF family hydrogenase formation chaperone [Leptolyngbya sp. PLA3]|nr:MAG: HypC/HybG/HupF family hydrogenase formation chaperone [Cyanobacteria bacterium CYA]MCE7967772.1 HypC/HybG/HupF family hydrogenase formation chaperone [Leptolyngbya sp. PL-A3]